MSQLLDTLASYVPWVITQHFAQNPTPLNEPYIERFPAAVLFADISGFTRLATEMTKHGSSGAEQLTAILNTYFGTLIDIIAGHGGDIVKFAGDALYAIWPTLAHQEELATVTHRAAYCGWLVQQQLSNYHVDDEHSLSMRIGVGAGEVTAVTVGGVRKRWEFLIVGQPVTQMNIANGIAQPSEIILSPEAWTLAQSYFVGEIIRDGYVKIIGVRETVRSQFLVPPILPPESDQALFGFVAGAIKPRLDAGQVEWLAENRRVTVLFVKINDLSEDTPHVIERLHEVMQAMQVTLYHYEGSVRQFIMDDKGTVFIAAFGVPPLTHEDDPIRGVQTALAIHKKLEKMGLNTSIGVATGLTFCGPIGNQLRREYAMVGSVVYLSARLMVAANGRILCDETTYQATRSRLRFVSLPAIPVKNHSQPVSIYAPSGKAQLKISLRPLIGRQTESNLLIQKLDSLEKGQNSIVVIKGDIGIGKSRLVGDLAAQAEARRFEIMIGEADSVDRATPYHGWRGILSHMFKMDNFTQTRSRSLAIMAKLASDSELLRLAPLLNAVLPLEIPENETTEHLAGEARAESTRSLLLRLLEVNTSKSPTVIILENAQWLDTASWALALAASQHLHPVMIIVVTRPFSDHSIESRQIFENRLTEIITLPSFNKENVYSLICQCLEVAAVPSVLAELIEQKADGNPFFIEQLAYTLRDSEYLRTADGEIQLTSPIEEIRQVNLPDTIQGVITSRIDRLTPQLQLTLKVASVIGQVFSVRALHDIYPIKSERDQIRDHLEILAQLDLIEVEIPEPDVTYRFKHSVTQEVAYNLMLFSQRRDFHEAVARWYERNFVYDLSPFYSFLAYHWKQAEVPTSAMGYLERAIRQALRGGSYHEVIDFVNEALSIEENMPLRQVRWSNYATEAHWGLGQLKETRQEAERILDLLGYPMPTSRYQLMWGEFVQGIVQMLHRLFPKRYIGSITENQLTLLQVVNALRRVQEVAYFSNDRLAAYYAGFRAVNLAERLDQNSADLAALYANAVVGLGSLRQHRFAKNYIRLAIETAQKVKDPRTTAVVQARIGLYYVSIGQWQKAYELFNKAIKLSDQSGDLRGLGDGLTALSFAKYLHGRFHESAAIYQELHKTATAMNNREQIAWSMSGRGSIALLQGELEEASTYLEEAHKLLSQTIDRLALINNLGRLILAHQRSGHLQQAKALATATEELIENIAPMGYVTYGGYVGLPEFYLEEWEKTKDSSYANLAKHALNYLRQYAHIYPIGRPRLWLLSGQYHMLKGQRGKATRCWQKSLDIAEALDMRYEAGLAHYELGRYLESTHPQKRYHLEQAIAIFQNLGTLAILDRAKSMIALL